MKPTKTLLNIFNRKGYRWIISFLFFVFSLVKNKKIQRFKYDKAIRKWKQYDKNLCYYIDIRPNWKLNIDYLEKHVYENNFVQYHPKNGDIVIDVGAGVGTESIVYSMKVGSGKVYAIEAHPQTFNSLSETKKANNLNNVIVSNIAISNSNDTIYIESRDNHAQNSIWRSSAIGTPIQAYTLDEYIRINKINHINFLKMNIEGAELNAIKGMTECIKIIDYLAISCHDFLFENNSTEIKDTVTSFLKKNNFNIISKNTGHIVIDSWIYAAKIDRTL